MSDMESTYGLTPASANVLANMSYQELLDAYGEQALLIMRFVEGRERRELEPPSDSEIEAVSEWLAIHIADRYLLSLTLKGMCYIDIEPDGEFVYTLTSEGRDAIEQSK